MTPRKSIFPKNAYRPESIVLRAKKNTSVLDEIRKKSAYTVRNNNYARLRQYGVSQNRSKNEANPNDGSHLGDNPQVSDGKTAGKIKTFSIPLIPSLVVLFLVVFLIIRHQDGITSLMDRDVVPPSSLEDSGGRSNMISYAGINTAENMTGNIHRPLANGLESSAMVLENSISIENSNESNIEDLNGDADGEALIETPMHLRMAEIFSWDHYEVRRGDSVSRIAAEYGLSYDAIIASNNLSNAHLLRVGQSLRIPNMNGIPYVVKQGDTLSTISRTWNIPLEVIVDVNNIQEDFLTAGQTIFLPGARMPIRDLRLALGTLFIHPLRGVPGIRLTSGFGWRPDPFTGVQSLHQAVDWAAPSGTIVRAASDGRVSMVGTDPGYGRYIILSHSDNFETLYAHLSAISVRQGDRVEQGVKIGEVGNTGRSTGPHLHFSLYRSRRAVNPLDFIAL